MPSRSDDRIAERLVGYAESLTGQGNKKVREVMRAGARRIMALENEVRFLRGEPVDRIVVLVSRVMK